MVHTWRVLLDKLPTRVALQQRDGLSFNPGLSCVFCFRYNDDSEHLFFLCNVSEQVWMGIGKWIGLKEAGFSSVWDHLVQHGIS